MDSDEIYKIFGILAIIIGFVYILARTLNYQSKILEGLTNPSKKNNKTDVYANLDKLIKTKNDKLEDSLLLNKYKSQFEDTIIELDKNTDLKILQLISSYGEAVDANDDKSINDILGLFDKLNGLKSSLQNGMNFLDTYGKTDNSENPIKNGMNFFGQS